MWWSVPDGIDTFATWKEVTTVYHEGAPGHHLQNSQTLAEQENLNRWQRLCAGSQATARAGRSTPSG